jgi:membrane protease YdiL (CAAX protease family)
MTEAAKRESSPREIATFLFVAFTASWVIWILGIRAGAPAELLIFGAAGPALAAAVMRMRRPEESTSPRQFPAGLFLLLTAAAWVAQVLAAAVRTRCQSLSSHPLLLLAALVAALSAARLYASGDIRLEWSRWPLIAIVSMPAFLLIPAGIAHFAHLPVVQPRPNEGLLMTIGVSPVVFTKEFLFAGLLEESGWRGWLLPRLQQRWCPLVASLYVWLPWALWHAPLDFTGGAGRTWMNYIQVRVVFFIAISILLTWFFNRSGGSIVVVSLFHAAFNTFPFVFPYSPPFLVLILLWSIWVVIADRMWRLPKPWVPPSTSGEVQPHGAQAEGSR